jgi:hypothetical protein
MRKVSLPVRVHRRLDVREMRQPLRYGALLLLLCAILVLLTACAQSSATKPSSTPTLRTTATPAAVTLPAFSDWRAAYLDARGSLHAVSSDGKTDVVGPKLAGLNANGTGVVAAGFSPDGHLLAYAGDTNTVVTDVTGREATGGIPSFAAIYNMHWSPDGSELEADDNVGNIMIEHLPDGKVTSLAEAAATLGFRPAALGWIDATHLAVSFGLSTDTTQAFGIGSIDVTSGQARTLATFSAPASSSTWGSAYFSLSPDGAEALLYNQPFRNDPFTPQVDVIDTATGAVTPLPHITSVMGGNTFATVAWRTGTGTQTVAVSIGFGVGRSWLLDVAHDSATPIGAAGYPAGWSPDGKTLILSSGWQSAINAGPIQLTAVAFADDGTQTTAILTKVAYTFTFLGFVKTA